MKAIKILLITAWISFFASLPCFYFFPGLARIRFITQILYFSGVFFLIPSAVWAIWRLAHLGLIHTTARDSPEHRGK
jgi:hypothetical protein